jgi:hypothetical protein
MPPSPNARLFSGGAAAFAIRSGPLPFRGRSASQGDSSVVQSCPLLPYGHRSDAERTLLSIYA